MRDQSSASRTRFEKKIMKWGRFYKSVFSVVMRHNAVQMKGFSFMKNHGRSFS
jgi:hypothetical protein